MIHVCLLDSDQLKNNHIFRIYFSSQVNESYRSMTKYARKNTGGLCEFRENRLIVHGRLVVDSAFPTLPRCCASYVHSISLSCGMSEFEFAQILL